MSETTTTTSTNATTQQQGGQQPAPSTGQQQAPSTGAAASSTSGSTTSTSGPSEREKALEQELAKLKAAEQKRTEDEAKAKGDTQKLLDIEREKAAKFEADLKRRDADDRKRTIVERALEGVAPERRADAHGRLLVLQEQHGWDPHAEDVDKAVTERRAALEKAMPELFAKTGKKPSTSTGTGEKPPTAGEHGSRAKPTRPAWQQSPMSRP